MLHVNERVSHLNESQSIIKASIVGNLKTAISIVRRQLPLISVVMLCSLLLSITYLFVTPKRFTSLGEMVIDTQKNQVLQQQSVVSDPEIDSSTIQTQVGVIKSKNVSLAVIRKLHLAEDPEFAGSGFLGSLLSFVSGKGPNPEAEKLERVLAYFEAHRSVKRQGLTYIIEIEFTSLNAKKSADIVNAIMDCYVEDRLAAKYEATRRAEEWLLERVVKVRDQAVADDQAVVEFKKKNNLIDTGIVPGTAQDRLLSEQQLSEVNSQLVLAATATVEAKARYERIRNVMSQDIPDSAFTDSLKNEVIIALRRQYLTLVQREAEISQKYGAGHMAAVNLRAQMQEVRRNISDEMRKIEEGYKNDYEIASAREESLRKRLASIVGDSVVSNQALVQLHELKSKADLSRSLHEDFLKRYMELDQQREAIAISEARAISPAAPNSQSSSPKILPTLAFFLIGGSIVGFGAAYLRETSSGDFRTRGQVEDLLSVRCLTEIPVIKAPRQKSGPTSRESGNNIGSNLDRYVVESPFSLYTEAIKAIKIAWDMNSQKVIGITSSISGEGKSTIASNLAHLIAHVGGKVILVDADLHRASLTKRLAPDSPGLVEVVSRTLHLDEAISVLPVCKLHFLSTGETTNLPYTNEILASVSMRNLIDALRAKYDYVIIDLSPVIPIVDVRTTGHFIDNYVYVIEWGKTKVEMIKRGLAEAHCVYDRLLGVVLNKVEMETTDLYENYIGKGSSPNLDRETATLGAMNWFGSENWRVRRTKTGTDRSGGRKLS